MSKTYGYNTAVRINSVVYRVATCMVQYRSDTHDVTATEGQFGPGGSTEPRRERGVGLGEAEVRMSAFLDPEISLHVAPVSIRVQKTIATILIYAAGLNNAPDELTNVLVDEVSKDPVGDPQQPNKVTFHGFASNFREAGTAGGIVVVTLTNTPTGGTFTLSVTTFVAGVYATQTTSALAYSATGATVQVAIRALSNVGGTTTFVTGPAGGPYEMAFDEDLGNVALGFLTVTGDGALLTGAGAAPGVAITYEPATYP